MIVLDEAHLRRILGEHAAYYNESRTNRSLGKDAPVSRPVQRIGSIRSHALLGCRSLIATYSLLDKQRSLEPRARLRNNVWRKVEFSADLAHRLLGGQMQVLFTSMSSSIEYVRAGKFARQRSQPRRACRSCRIFRRWVSSCRATSRASGPALAREKTRRPRLLRSSTSRSMQPSRDPKMKARLAELGATALPGSPADFSKLMAEEIEKWGKVVKFSGAKPD